MKKPFALIVFFTAALPSAQAASVFWSFQTTAGGVAGSGTNSGFTANDGFAGTPSVVQYTTNTPGPGASIGTGGDNSYTYKGTTWLGSNTGSAPGFSMLWGTNQGASNGSGLTALAGIGFTVTLNMTGLTDLNMRFDVRSATGSNSAALPPSKFSLIEYSLDNGSNWNATSLAAGTGWLAQSSTVFEEETINLSSVTAINNQSNVKIRFVFQDGSVPTSDITQNIRIDNLLFTAIPEPSAAALALAGVLGTGLRRRRK